MPYTSQEIKDVLDPAVDHLLNALREVESDYPETSTEGNLNYVISQLLNTLYTSGGYSAVNDAVGVLECVKHQFYRQSTLV